MSLTGKLRSPEPSPRAIGLVYLSYALTGAFGAFLLRGIVVSGDATATATNILAHQTLYRAGFSFDLAANVLYGILTALFFGFFRHVDRAVSTIAGFCGLGGCTVQIAGEVFRIAPLMILRNASLGAQFSAAQVRTAAIFSLSLHSETIRIAIVLFAVFDLAVGYLIIRSTFVPSVLGALMMVGGAGAMTLLWPPLAVNLHYVIVPLGGVAELLLMLWLILKGSRAVAPALPAAA